MQNSDSDRSERLFTGKPANADFRNHIEKNEFKARARWSLGELSLFSNPTT
jgi:hypothetical protein